MSEVFILIFITCSLNLGFQIAIQPSMIFEKVGIWGNKMVEKGNYFFEVVTCPWCRPSVLSIIAFLITWGAKLIYPELYMVLLYPVIIGASSIISGIIWSLYLLISKHLSDNGEPD